MTYNPLVSIIIPVYNRERFVRDAIESALRQTYSNIEVIVIDNCSADNTWNVVNEYSDIRLKSFRNERNIGPVKNWEKGIKLAKGEYIKILFSDDYIEDNYIEKTVCLFSNDIAFVLTSIKFVYNEIITDVKVFDNKKEESKKYFDDRFLIPLINYPISPGCAIFRRLDLLKAEFVTIPNPDGLDSLKNGAGIDLLFFLNCAKVYPKFITTKQTFAYFRVHEDSFSCSSNLDHYYEWAKIYFLEKYPNNNYTDYLRYKYKIKLGFDQSYMSEYDAIHYSNRKNKLKNKIIYICSTIIIWYRKKFTRFKHKIQEIYG